MAPHPPFALYQVAGLAEADWPAVRARYAARLAGLFTDEPIPFRPQDGGDHDDQQRLLPGLAPGVTGLRLHQREPAPASGR